MIRFQESVDCFAIIVSIGAEPMRIAPFVAVAALGLLALLAAGASANGADSAAGQKIFAGTCTACHQLKSYAGESETELETEVKGIVAGTIKHPKKLTLSDTDAANVAAYISGNQPK
jgi:mono/diheme cytochrome c family protein